MTPTTALGLSIRLSMFELRETGDWDVFPGPPERARAETGGADQWVLKQRECSGFARVNKVTSASLGYPLSVFNKNSTLKKTRTSNTTAHPAKSCLEEQLADDPRELETSRDYNNFDLMSLYSRQRHEIETQRGW